VPVRGEKPLDMRADYDAIEQVAAGPEAQVADGGSQ
jgi:hypothetical protein